MVEVSDRSKQWWETFWGNPEQDFGPPTRQLLDFASEYKKRTLGPLNAIDIPTGNGRYAIPLVKMGYSVDALDISEKGVERLLDEAKKQDLQTNAQVADFFSIPEGEARSYNLILSSGFLEEIDQVLHPQIINRFMQWTKPGGINIVKYCIDIIDRGRRTKENFIPKLYKDAGWDILYINEEPSLRDSQARINFEKKIRTGTVVAMKNN